MHPRVTTKWEARSSLPTKDQETLTKPLTLGMVNQTLIGHEHKPSQVYKMARFPLILPICQMYPPVIKQNLRRLFQRKLKNAPTRDIAKDFMAHINVESNRNSSSPKHVHFINTITIISKKDEPREAGIIEPNATKKNDHNTIVEVEEKVIEEGESHDIERDNLDDRVCRDTKEVEEEGEYGIKEVTFKTPYKDSEIDDLASEGHDLLSSRVILSEGDYRRGCKRASNLESGFYMDVDKLDLSYKDETDKINLDASSEVGGSMRSDVSAEGGVTCLRHSGGGLILYQAYGNLYAMTAFGKLLEEIHMTWTQFRKKQDKMAALHKVTFKECVQCLRTASRFMVTPSELTCDGVKTFVTTSERNRLNETLEDSAKRWRQDSCDETDIRQKDEKLSKNGQNRAWNGIA
ncbi:hypothetical protein Tco_1386477 [Tanacetum coccineum]